MMGAMALVDTRSRMRLRRATATAWSVVLPKVFVLMTGASLVSVEDIVMFPDYMTVSSGFHSNITAGDCKVRSPRSIGASSMPIISA